MPFSFFLSNLRLHEPKLASNCAQSQGDDGVFGKLVEALLSGSVTGLVPLLAVPVSVHRSAIHSVLAAICLHPADCKI